MVSLGFSAVTTVVTFQQFTYKWKLNGDFPLPRLTAGG